MNMNDTMNRVIMGMIVVILVTGAYYVGRVNGSKPANDADQILDMVNVVEGEVDASSDISANDDVTVSTSISGGEAVTVVDQPAGSIVKVESVTLVQTGWVAVRDSKGWVLGARRFEAGTTKDGEVVLQRDTVAGEKYQVLLYNDDGDKEYDLHKDSLVMNADASVVGATFSAQ